MKIRVPDCHAVWRAALFILTIGLFLGAPVESDAQLTSSCDSTILTPEYSGPGCCWDFILTTNSNLQPFNSVQATILTQNATVLSATGGFPSTTTAITASWGFPNNLPKGSTRINGCFTSQSGSITLLFEWKYNGITICTDTVTLDCPSGGGEQCHTDTVRLNTGWNPFSESLDTVGEYTTYWRIIEDPEFGTTEPRPAVIVPTDSIWNGPLGASRWISSYPDSNDHVIGKYVFQTCFCTRGDIRDVRLFMDILADDRARVYVNGNFVGGTPTTLGYRTPANRINTDITRFLTTGRNCITVEVDNATGRKMGLNIDGYITANGLGLEEPKCCYNGGAITGTKFHDLNCNGTRDPGEPGIAGFRIVSDHGDSTLTDGRGNYYFLDVPIGAYLVHEVNLPGWRQSFPDSTNPRHSAQVVPGKGLKRYDFGNCNDEVDSTGCLQYDADSTWCDEVNGKKVYSHRFSVRSLLPCKANQVASISVVGPPGVTVSPGSFLVSGSFYQQTISISGPGATPGTTVALEVEVCCIEGGGQGQAGDTVECCREIIRVTLPECRKEDDEDPKECRECCNEFPKEFPRLSQWSSSSGISSITGIMGAGTDQICKVTATLTEVRINGSPAFGQFVPINLLDGQVGVQPSMHEVEWTNVDVSTGPRPFNMRVQIPGMPWNAISDQVEYCIRFRFTDVNCVTCDTVICFTQQRSRWIFPGGFTLPNGIAPEKGSDPTLSSAAEGIEGELTGPEAGRLDVTFPTPPAALGPITYVGLEIYPAEEFVEITGATSTGYTFRTSGFGVASDPFSADPGDQLSVDLTYNGLNNRSSLDHWVTIRFVRQGFELDTLEETGPLTFYRQAFQGGDSLELGEKMEDVRTWGLWLHNRNGSDEPLARLQLSTPEGIEILAVGPGPDRQNAVIAFVDGTTDAAAIDLAGLASTVDADGTVGPIYVTLGGTLDMFDIGFATLNGAGITISEGSVTVNDDPTSVSDGRGLTGNRLGLLEGLYPNPTTQNVTVAFRLQSSGQTTTIRLLDAAGRDVLTLLERDDLHAGEHRLSFDTEGLASGTYHVVLNHGDRVERLPLQIVR